MNESEAVVPSCALRKNSLPWGEGVYSTMPIGFLGSAQPSLPRDAPSSPTPHSHSLSTYLILCFARILPRFKGAVAKSPLPGLPGQHRQRQGQGLGAPPVLQLPKG